MNFYAKGSSAPISGRDLVRAVLRTDLTPVPSTVELTLRDSDQSRAFAVDGGQVEAGPNRIPYKIVKASGSAAAVTASVQGERPQATIDVVAMLASCEAIARPLSRAVIREGATLGGIFSACGASARIGADFTVPLFACLYGQTPSFAIAQVLQEEAGVLAFDADTGITFRRLGELFGSAPTMRVPISATESVESVLLQRQGIPLAISTTPAGTGISGRKTEPRRSIYRPRADARVLNNMGQAIVTARLYRSAYMPGVAAGRRVDVGDVPHVIVTAAHVLDLDGGQSESYSQFWLGGLAS